MSRTIRLRDGQVWVAKAPSSRTPSRRILAVTNGSICYCAGGERNRWCQRRAFRAWIRRYHAVATRTRRPRTLVLRKAGSP